MDLTQQEKQIIINLLSQISLPVSQTPVVLKIIEKLKFSISQLDLSEKNNEKILPRQNE